MIFGSSAASQEHALVQGYRTIWRKPTPVARQATRAGGVKTIPIRGQTAPLTYASAPTSPRQQQPSDRHRRQGEVMPPRLQTPFVRTTPETASANIADTNASETTPAPETASANIADANKNETTPGLQAIMVHGTTAKDEGEVATSKGGGGKH